MPSVEVSLSLLLLCTASICFVVVCSESLPAPVCVVAERSGCDTVDVADGAVDADAGFAIVFCDPDDDDGFTGSAPAASKSAVMSTCVCVR